MTGKGDKARKTILKTARDLIYRKGFGATSYADIARESGYAVGNIQYYFKSKDDILHAVNEQRLGDFGAMLDGWEASCSDARACLGLFVDMFERNAVDLSEFGCPMGTLNEELGKGDHALQKETRRMFDLYIDWLERQFLRLDPSLDARNRAVHLMAMVQGLSLLAHTYRDPEIVRRQTAIVRDWLDRNARATVAS